MRTLALAVVALLGDWLLPLATGPTDQAIAPWVIPAIIAGVSAVSGAIKNRSQNRQQSSTTPTFDPTFAPLRDMLLRNVSRSLNQGYMVPQAERASTIGNINQTFAGGDAALNANLTARGLGSSPAAIPALAQRETQRGAAINAYEASIPGIEYGRQQDALSRALGLLGMGTGSTTTSTGTQTAGGGVGGGLEGLGSILGMILAQRRYGAASGGYAFNAGQGAGEGIY